MARGFNWARVAGEARLRRFGSEPAFFGLPLSNAKKKSHIKNMSRAPKAQRPVVPEVNVEAHILRKVARAVENYMHAVAWSEIRNQPTPNVPKALFSKLGEKAQATAWIHESPDYPAIKKKLQARHEQRAQLNLNSKKLPSSRTSAKANLTPVRLQKLHADLEKLRTGHNASKWGAMSLRERKNRINALKSVLARLSLLKSRFGHGCELAWIPISIPSSRLNTK